MAVCQFTDLGCAPYRETWALQETAMEAVKSAKANGERGRNQLFFVEHRPVFTVGRNGKADNMLASEALLRDKETEFIRVDRGGDITYHGPGQLVVYPIFDLEELALGIKAYVAGLEETVIRTLDLYGIKGDRLEGATGVWIEPHTPRARKICAIGVKCSRSVTMHGLALNINTDLSYFQMINPCGFVDKGVTSMQRELGTPLDFGKVSHDLRRSFSEVFGLEFR